MNEISKKRKALGMTQQELGDLCNVSWKTISNLERSVNVRYSLLAKVCEILGLEITLIDVSPVEEKKKPKKNDRVKLID
jgi:transcriptional regulator with XRE-family HTH domain